MLLLPVFCRTFLMWVRTVDIADALQAGDFLRPVAGAQLRQHVLLGPGQAPGAGEHLHRERLAARRAGCT